MIARAPTVSLFAVSSLCEPHRRALAAVVAAACPADTWPHALLLIGISDVEEALRPHRQVAVFWAGPGEADDLIGSPLLQAYIANGTPVICLMRSYADGQRIVAALQQVGACAHARCAQ